MDNDILRAVSILRDLSNEELDMIANLLTVREAKKGEKLLEEGTIVNHLYIVCDGAVHVRRLAQTREILLGRLGVGAHFGEINMFDPGTATASIYAMKTPTRLAYVDYESLRGFMSAHATTGYKIVSAMMTEMARRLRQTSARLVNSVYWATPDAKKELKEAAE
ncbi:MAG: Crp/Fnr family transcriptional regulator [Candidatus Udaeobacter sp.]